MAKDFDSVTGGKGLTVAPSPLNEVKLDLGIILAIGVLLLLVPPGVAGPLPLYLGKLLILAAMTVTMVHFTRLFPVVHSEPSE